MEDIFNAKLICDGCDIEAIPKYAEREGFKIRVKECSKCGKIWYHPGDMHNFNEFKQLKNRDFEVKLRMVGNSFCVSIPREIIAFKELERELDQFVKMCLEEPNKLVLFFNRRI